MLFNHLETHSLVIKTAKCVFGMSQIDFLGHRLDACGISPLPTKVKVVCAFSCPLSVKVLQEFIGMVNFYHRFILAASKSCVPSSLLHMGS